LKAKSCFMRTNFTIFIFIAALLFFIPNFCFAQSDACGSAMLITSSTGCSTTSGNVYGSSYTAGPPTTCGTPTYDVWYKFVAQTTNPTITMTVTNGQGGNIVAPGMQLFSGDCTTGLTSLGCISTGGSPYTISAAGLIINDTYYIRIFSTSGAAPTSKGAFTICITDPVPPTPATYDISRSYINVTKGNTGGTVNPGDTLEMRAILYISSKTLDSLSFTDTLYNTKGMRLVPGSIALRTNEGKVYGNGASPFTDALDSDAGWYSTNGLDTIVRINFGTGASNTKRGSLSNTSNPKAGGNCLIMATYRVVVYAPYNTKINFKTGALSFRDQTTAVLTNATFSPNNFIVYQSPGLCPNAVSATNALGAESNGTFGAPSGSAPLARNRGTTPYIGAGYTYKIFSATGSGPNDNYYGIANNTSGTYTTVNTWPKPDGGTGYRVFNLWDITGDHTGATNAAKGNPACDTTKPVSAANPCGYMLVVNSAYKADTAFSYAVNNLCPNTYYELSAWFKNICYKCGADSLGRGASALSYIPTAPGDSSGVRPNIAFDVNGTDYYTTGDVRYLGLTTPTGSDSSNQWVKRGFVYLTGPSETSFLLTLRNNAPGGGGNDWALDDISVATCLPNMRYSPSLNPTVCQTNPITINDTIRSYFNTYQNYKWQRSIDNGSTWTDIGATGSAIPVLNGTEWEYITSYTVPPSATNLSDSGNRYRVVVSTTSGNLNNASCQVTDGISLISMNVIDCGTPLKADLLSFNGRLFNNQSVLSWATSREEKPVRFFIEKSTDGTNFTRIGTVDSYNNPAVENNTYSFTDPVTVTGKTMYRIAVSSNAVIKYSRTIQLGTPVESFKTEIKTNPFNKDLYFDVTIDKDAKIEVLLLNATGNVVKQKSYTGYAGINSFSLQNTESLAPGIYILQVQQKDKMITRKVIKN
jgi:trimeric autotransporter adhesin